MTITIDPDSMTLDERLELIGVLWDGMPDAAGRLPLSDALKAELNRRVEAYESGESQASSWSDAKARILNRRDQRK